MMLCSDGVSDVLDEAAISRELERMDCQQLARGCATIIQAALHAGTRDNATIIIVGIDS
jgi:serine/threonine protein phosphatase PrpC